MWNGTTFGDLDWPLNASCSLSAIAEFLVITDYGNRCDIFWSYALPDATQQKSDHLLTNDVASFTSALWCQLLASLMFNLWYISKMPYLWRAIISSTAIKQSMSKKQSDWSEDAEKVTCNNKYQPAGQSDLWYEKILQWTTGWSPSHQTSALNILKHSPNSSHSNGNITVRMLFTV